MDEKGSADPPPEEPGRRERSPDEAGRGRKRPTTPPRKSPSQRKRKASASHDEMEGEHKRSRTPPWHEGGADAVRQHRPAPQAEGPEVETLPLWQLRFTHDTIKPRFRDGRSLEELIEQLKRGEHNLKRAWFLELDVVLVNKKYYSLSNRRLHCLKEYQRWSENTVFVKAKVTKIVDPVICKFFSSLTTQNGGTSVEIRERPPARTFRSPPRPPRLSRSLVPCRKQKQGREVFGAKAKSAGRQQARMVFRSAKAAASTCAAPPKHAPPVGSGPLPPGPLLPGTLLR